MTRASIKGLRTVVYQTPDLVAGRAFYTAVVEKEPYFDEPFYVGYEVGGFELGLVPDGPGSGRGRSVAYWGVDDATAATARLVDIGATIEEPVHDVGGGILSATLLDPFGNAFGVIENPHFSKEKVQ